YRVLPNGSIELSSLAGLVFNPWILWQYAHNMTAAVVTGSFAMSALGAFYLLTGRHVEHARIFVRLGVIAGVIASCCMMFPTGDGQGRNIAEKQPITLAAMEGLFETQAAAPVVILGQPNVQERRLDNPIQVPGVLSLLTYRRWAGVIKGLNDYPQADWPDNIELLYY